MKNESGIQPLGDKVLVKAPDMEKKSAGGVILPDQTLKKQEQGTTEAVIIAVGPTAFLEYREKKSPLPISPGDQVCMARYAGQTYTGDDGDEYRLINEVDIAGVKR